MVSETGPVRLRFWDRSCRSVVVTPDNRSQPVCQSHKNLPPANQENIWSERASARGRSGRASDEQRTHEGWVFDDGFERIPTHVRVAQDAAQRQCDERPHDVRVFLDVPPLAPGRNPVLAISRATKRRKPRAAPRATERSPRTRAR